MATEVDLVAVAAISAPASPGMVEVVVTARAAREKGARSLEIEEAQREEATMVCDILCNHHMQQKTSTFAPSLASAQCTITHTSVVGVEVAGMVMAEAMRVEPKPAEVGTVEAEMVGMVEMAAAVKMEGLAWTVEAKLVLAKAEATVGKEAAMAAAVTVAVVEVEMAKVVEAAMALATAVAGKVAMVETEMAVATALAAMGLGEEASSAVLEVVVADTAVLAKAMVAVMVVALMVAVGAAKEEEKKVEVVQVVVWVMVKAEGTAVARVRANMVEQTVVVTARADVAPVAEVAVAVRVLGDEV